jgi:hypothetical protein
MDLQALKIDYPRLKRGEILTELYIDRRFRSSLAKMLLSHSLSERMIAGLSRAVKYLDFVRDRMASHRQALANLARDATDAQSWGSSYGYEDELRELSVAHDYHREIEEGFPRPTESLQLYQHVVDTVSRELSRDVAITSFVNFGVSYAHVDSVLAARHPAVKFVGIDRGDLTRLYNQRYFSDRANMEFESGDILEFLRARAFEKGLFFHARTLTCLSHTNPHGGKRHNER